MKEGAKTLVANAQNLMKRMGEGTMTVAAPVNPLACARLTNN